MARSAAMGLLVGSSNTRANSVSAGECGLDSGASPRADASESPSYTICICAPEFANVAVWEVNKWQSDNATCVCAFIHPDSLSKPR